MDLKEFKIFNSIPNNLKSIIKSFYIFGDNPIKTALFVTNDDKVFGFGDNSNGVCGQGYERRIREPLIITELSDKKVKEFFNGYDFVLCLTSDNKLFSWGINDHGQLGIGGVDMNRNYSPHLINELNDNIIQVCCGGRHSLVLTEEGVVYGWGDNRWGQTGVGLQSDKVIISPKQWNIESKVIKIHCSFNHSFAITECGKVYCCGRNDHCQFGSQWDNYGKVCMPSLINIVNVQNIITSETNIYFLTNESDVYFCGLYYKDDSPNKTYQKVPVKILNLKNIQMFTSSNYKLNGLKYGMIFCENLIYELKFDKIKRTGFKTFEDYFYDHFDNEIMITYKTVHINQDEIDINSYLCEIITENYIPRYLRFKNNINKFEISDNILENVKQIIKYFHAFESIGQNILFVTSDDKVFGMGNNYYGVCGLGHQNEINSIELIPELCDKRVKQFFIGSDFVLCLTSDNQLYSWGKNNHGQLGIGQLNEYKIFKPQLNEYFNNKTFLQVCCGQYHSAVLTSDNCVHLWGYYNNEKDIESPIECVLEEEIKSICCSEIITFCVTKCGKVYYWEVNNKKIKPISFKLSNIQSICSTKFFFVFNII